ncbi:MAG: ABC transporter permease [Nocardioidaceae bacterium]
MSTTMTAPTTIDLGSTRRVSMTRLIEVELRKLIDTRAGRWLLIIIGLVTAAAVVIFLFAAHPADLTYGNFVDVTATPQGILLPVLGILAVTTEFTQRTELVTFTLEPNRMRVVVAKFVAAIVLGVAAAVLALAVAALGNVLGMALHSGAGGWSFGAGGVRDVFTLQLMGIVQGVAFGMLFMNTAVAIVAFFVVPIVWSVLFNVVSALSGAAPWIDLGTAQTPLQSHDMTGSSWVHLLVAGSIWIVVPLVLGVLRLLRHEVK